MIRATPVARRSSGWVVVPAGAVAAVLAGVRGCAPCRASGGPGTDRVRRHLLRPRRSAADSRVLVWVGTPHEWAAPAARSGGWLKTSERTRPPARCSRHCRDCSATMRSASCSGFPIRIATSTRQGTMSKWSPVLDRPPRRSTAVDRRSLWCSTIVRTPTSANVERAIGAYCSAGGRQRTVPPAETLARLDDVRASLAGILEVAVRNTSSTRTRPARRRTATTARRVVPELRLAAMSPAQSSSARDSLLTDAIAETQLASSHSPCYLAHGIPLASRVVRGRSRRRCPIVRRSITDSHHRRMWGLTHRYSDAVETSVYRPVASQVLSFLADEHAARFPARCRDRRGPESARSDHPARRGPVSADAGASPRGPGRSDRRFGQRGAWMGWRRGCRACRSRRGRAPHEEGHRASAGRRGNRRRRRGTGRGRTPALWSPTRPPMSP